MVGAGRGKTLVIYQGDRGRYPVLGAARTGHFAFFEVIGFRIRRGGCPHQGHRPNPECRVSRIQVFHKHALHFLFQALFSGNQPKRLDVRLNDTNPTCQQFCLKVGWARVFHQPFIRIGSGNAEALRLAFERHDQPHRNPVILSRPPIGYIDFDQLLPRGSYRMPILQNLCFQGTFIEYLLGTEEGFLGGIEGSREGKHQGCQ